ncbi:MAG: flippase-like domain-containing protein [Anaerolineae bacterium]|nr:flippase-like domain-containing protein [Anaerolineae bacterium]
MPAKSGEISYPILLKKNLGLSFISGTAILVAARFFDFATIALFIPPVLMIFWGELSPWLRIGAILFSLTVFLTGLLAIKYIRHSDKVSWFQMSAEPLPSNPSIWKRGRGLIGQLLNELHSIDNEHQYWRLWLLTIGIWLCVQTNFYLIILSLGYQMTFFQSLWYPIIMVPMTLLPLQGFANLGTHEIGWIAAFTLFNSPTDVALSIAVNSHILLLAFVLLIGFLGWLLLQEFPSRHVDVEPIKERE